MAKTRVFPGTISPFELQKFFLSVFTGMTNFQDCSATKRRIIERNRLLMSAESMKNSASYVDELL